MAAPKDSWEREERVNNVIAAYLDALDAGNNPIPRDILEQHRDLADDLEEFFGDSHQFARFAEPIQAASGLHHPPSEAVTQTLAGHSRDAEVRHPGEFTIRDGCFDDYELLEEIGRGGMGVVYRARQISLNRVVALKMVLAGQLASTEDVRRFQVEAEAAANLDHPGIVPIFEVGAHAGQHYFSMAFIAGQSLAVRLQEGPLPARQAAEILKPVCDAVQYAHEHDVIHRDLKPANILLEHKPKSQSERLVGGTVTSAIDSSSQLRPHIPRPRITDFGLAKRLTGASDLTGTGQILGTPSYMSPEQAAGDTARIGPASDIYSLGVILYQMLTGRPPFQAETSFDTLSQVLDADPVPPRLLNRNVPRDLEAICLKCLNKTPERRYAEAGHLGDDLQRYLEGETIEASGVNLLDRLARALSQSRYEPHFRGWGLGLIAFGLVILLSHIGIYVLEQTQQETQALYWIPRSVMFAALLITLWRFRDQSILPTNSAERLVWVVWVGYLLALGAVNTVRLVLGGDQRESYAYFAILAGLGFLVMGGHVWRGGYLVGLGFMVAAPVLAQYTYVAPLLFGALWAGALLVFGLHYWRRGCAAQAHDAISQ